MKSLLTLLCAAALFMALAGPVDAEAPAEEPESLESVAENPPSQPYVFNGEPVANPGWVTSILYDGFYICAGSLVHPQWMLTAAHCVDGADANFSVNVGADKWFEGTSRTLAEVHIHPGYDPFDSSSVDLAVVKLSSAVSGTALPVLASSPSWPVLYQNLFVMGWGETFTSSPVPDNLQGAWVRVDSDSTGAVDEAWCLDGWVAPSGYDDFCFGGVSSVSGESSWACPGDSGGPLVGYATPSSTSGSLNTIYGLTSFGESSGCSDHLVDTIAQSVGPHLAWINSFINPPGDMADEILFYRTTDGTFKYYQTKPDGSLGEQLKSGTYSLGWDSITAVDLNGDDHDEQFFYRSTDGVFKYYQTKKDGALGSLLKSGTYSTGWDSITKVDLNGDGKDEFFFYRSTDGTFKYYQTKADGSLGALLKSGVYSTGWSAITAVDLNGDGKDEFFFYRTTDGVFKYYQTKADGSLGSLLKSGTYSTGWDSITKVDLNGDGKDEFFFYRSTDGVFKYYQTKADGSLGSLLKSGVYSTGWSSITAVNLDGDTAP